ncbi:hypothetical protein ACP4OV_031274 [Aristida adscensionis]
MPASPLAGRPAGHHRRPLLRVRSLGRRACLTAGRPPGVVDAAASPLNPGAEPFAYRVAARIQAEPSADGVRVSFLARRDPAYRVAACVQSASGCTDADSLALDVPGSNRATELYDDMIMIQFGTSICFPTKRHLVLPLLIGDDDELNIYEGAGSYCNKVSDTSAPSEKSSNLAVIAAVPIERPSSWVAALRVAEELHDQDLKDTLHSSALAVLRRGYEVGSERLKLKKIRSKINSTNRQRDALILECNEASQKTFLNGNRRQRRVIAMGGMIVDKYGVPQPISHISGLPPVRKPKCPEDHVPKKVHKKACKKASAKGKSPARSDKYDESKLPTQHPFEALGGSSNPPTITLGLVNFLSGQGEPGGGRY